MDEVSSVLATVRLVNSTVQSLCRIARQKRCLGGDVRSRAEVKASRMEQGQHRCGSRRCRCCCSKSPPPAGNTLKTCSESELQL